MASGHYDVRLPSAGAGPELDAVTAAFNSMAEQLAHTEDTRRRLLSDLGHELRTPLSTVRAYLESMDDGLRVWDAETRDVLHEQVNRLSMLANDVTDVSAAEEGRITVHRETIDVQGLLLAAATGSQDAYSRTGVDLLTSGPPTPTSINADARRLGQVLTNLLDNALRHSHAGQSVRLSAQVSHSEIEVSVADQGDGISSEQLIHVFERFYRADSARHRTGHGSGIGLTISKAIVEAHDGRIRAESAGVGRGTTITFALPIA